MKAGTQVNRMSDMEKFALMAYLHGIATDGYIPLCMDKIIAGAPEPKPNAKVAANTIRRMGLKYQGANGTGQTSRIAKLEARVDELETLFLRLAK